jgi:hypothetical protein
VNPDVLKRVVHLGSTGYGRLTAGHRMLPSFLISGGQRCGTTSLYRALAAHPDVVKAVLHKGVHYFDIGYDRGPRWYRGHFPIDRHNGKHTFESSPYYMYHPLAMTRIANDLPAVKIVVLLRDPVERAYSQHAHEVARGFEPETDFATALALEPARLDGVVERLTNDPSYYSFAHQHHAYRARGEYIEYLEPMAALLGRDRIHVVDSGTFFTAPERAYDGVLDFLGLAKGLYPPFEKHNARPRSVLDDAVRQELCEHFVPFDKRLSDWLGWRPSWT